MTEKKCLELRIWSLSEPKCRKKRARDSHTAFRVCCRSRELDVCLDRVPRQDVSEAHAECGQLVRAVEGLRLLPRQDDVDGSALDYVGPYKDLGLCAQHQRCVLR